MHIDTVSLTCFVLNSQHTKSDHFGILSKYISALVKTRISHKQTYLLPLSAVCTIEVIQFLGEPLLVKRSSLAAVLRLVKLSEALILSLSGNKDRKQQK